MSSWRFRQAAWGVALPRVPSSRAQLLPIDVAVNQRRYCAPDPVLLMRPDFLSSSFLSLWRFTLRRLLLASSRAVSPRPLPSRTFMGGLPAFPRCVRPMGASWRCSTVELVVMRRVAAPDDSILPWVCVQTGAVRRFVAVAGAACRSAVEHRRLPQVAEATGAFWGVRTAAGDESTVAGSGRSVRAEPKLRLESVIGSVPRPKVRRLTQSTQAVPTEVVR